MKRLICTLATLAMLIWTCPPAQAEYLGTLQRDQDWILNVDNSAGGGIGAVTVFYLGRRLDDIEIRTVPAVERVTLTFSKPGRGVRRIIIEVDSAPGGRVTVEIVQGSQTHTRNADGDGRLVFDVE